MILDEAKENRRACNIIVTQPRRIAARSIAERVSQERGWELGSIVGYQVFSLIADWSHEFASNYHYSSSALIAIMYIETRLVISPIRTKLFTSL